MPPEKKHKQWNTFDLVFLPLNFLCG